MSKNNIQKQIALILCLSLILCLLTGCGESPEVLQEKSSLSEEIDAKYAVSSSSEIATKVGMEVLEHGGNAVDAAVAVGLTLAVVEPYGSGLGGGGYMLVYNPKSESSWCLDYYSASGSRNEMASVTGIPGFLKGQQMALDKWGTKPLSDLISYAVKYAEDGFTASELLVKRLRNSEKVSNNPNYYGIEAGDTVYQPELAETLRKIQNDGIDVFYSGEIAQDIADSTGLFVSDLEDYKVYFEKAVSANIGGYTFFASSSPSSGLTTLQMMSMSYMLDIPSPDDDTPGYLNTLKQITQAAYSGRSKLVDPRLYDFDPDSLLTQDYLNSLLASSSQNEIPEDLEKKSTTQFAVIDSSGLTVCVTNTLSETWGSYETVDGFYLNNTLSLFGEKGKNSYEPNKRPRTHVSPMIIIGDDGYALAIGTPGGNCIPKIIVPVLLDILKFKSDPKSAVEKSRAIVDESGYLCVESPENSESIVDISEIPYGYYYSGSHLYFGCTSIVGFSPESGFFSVEDMRRTIQDSDSVSLFGWTKQ